MSDATVFNTGQILERGDLDIFLTDDVGNPTNAYSIHYALYYVDPVSNAEVLIGPAQRNPVNPAVGEYYASLMIPNNAKTGCYRIRWLFRETSGAPEEGVVQNFVVQGASALETDPYSQCVRDLITKLRFLTRDNNPDRNYRFRPPEGEGNVGCYNQVFGYIWTDEEFSQFLEIALWKWNMQPPRTDGLCTVDQLCQKRPSWQAALLWGALVTSAQALAYNWVSEEFSVAPETLVTVTLPDGRDVELSMEELHAICTEEGSELRQAIRTAFQGGNLRVRAVDPETGAVGLHVVKDVMRHETGDRPSVTCKTPDGREVRTTCDHSLFRLRGEGIEPIRADNLQEVDRVAEVREGSLGGVSVVVDSGAPLEISYDLCVPGPENFVLSNGIIAHNSYSIGGISLDIDKSSKYMDLKRNAEEQWDKLTEAKSRTEKYFRGLAQPRFGRGVRSSFGPQVGRGVLSPRSFL